MVTQLVFTLCSYISWHNTVSVYYFSARAPAPSPTSCRRGWTRQQTRPKQREGQLVFFEIPKDIIRHAFPVLRFSRHVMKHIATISLDIFYVRIQIPIHIPDFTLTLI